MTPPAKSDKAEIRMALIDAQGVMRTAVNSLEWARTRLNNAGAAREADAASFILGQAEALLERIGEMRETP